MTPPLTIPRIQVNAWDGAASVFGDVTPAWIPWALGEEAGRHVPAKLKPEEEALPERWDDPRVGWGVVLPRGIGLAGAPEPIRRLIEARRAVLGRVPVFEPFAEEDAAHHLTMLVDLEMGNSPTIDASPIGVKAGSIPQYLLIAGPPDRISWRLQETLSVTRFVGRLDLDEIGLSRYVEALLTGWRSSTANKRSTLTWAVQHNDDDITATLRTVVTRPLHLKLAGDPDIGGGAIFLDGRKAPATGQSLCQQLAANRPLLIATSSHGQTGPASRPDEMRRDLGLLVDHQTLLVKTDELLRDWQPDGAIWMAHACCSAGSKKQSAYTDLFPPTDRIGRLLRDVASLGDLTSPLPRALLGAEKPLRAFIGHVEPTFDWTVKQPETEQMLTQRLITPLHQRLFLSKPVGMALQQWHGRAASLNAAWVRLNEKLKGDFPLTPAILYPRLAAADCLATVLLGDPTAALPV
jgi:hypothetical protein